MITDALLMPTAIVPFLMFSRSKAEKPSSFTLEVEKYASYNSFVFFLVCLGTLISVKTTLVDKALNLIGIVTIAHWMFSGKKDRCLKIFPHPGVSEKDIKEARRFGRIILKELPKDKIDIDQTVLNEHGAICVLPSYIIFEKRIQKIFKIWSNFILQKGGPGDPERKFRVRLFFYYLLLAIFLIAPLATLVSFVARVINRKKIKEAVEYFSQNSLKH